MSYKIAIITTTTGNDRADMVDVALQRVGFTSNEIADANVGTTDFSTYDVIFVIESAVSVASLAAIGKPTIFGSNSPIVSAGIGSARTQLANDSAGAGFDVVNLNHEITQEWATGDQSIGLVISVFSISEGVSSSASVIGDVLTEWPGLNHRTTIAIEAGTSRIGGGVTWARWGYLGWTGQQRTIGGVQTLGNRGCGLMARMVMWLMDDLIGGGKNWDIPYAADDYNFENDSLGSPPADVTALVGTVDNVASDWNVLNKMRVVTPSHNDLYQWTKQGSATDKQDIYILWRKGSSVSDEMQLGAKDHKYYVQILGTACRFFRQGAIAIGSPVTLSSAFDEDQWIWSRFRCWDEGGSTTLQFKAWRGFLSDEPASWLLDTTNGVHFGVTGYPTTLFHVTTNLAVGVFSPNAGVLNDPPNTPTVTVEDITGSSATVDGSDFETIDPSNPTHVSTIVTIYKASDDSVVKTVTLTTGDLTRKVMGPLPSETELYAGMIYTDSNEKSSEEGFSANFFTLAFDGCNKIGTFNVRESSDLTLVGNVSSTLPWGNYISFGNPLDGLPIAFRFGVLNKPRVLVLNSCRTHDEADVRVRGGFDGEVAGGYYSWYRFSFNRFQSIEWSGLGVAMLCEGEFGNTLNPFSGVIGWLNIGVPFPYGTETTQLSKEDCGGLGKSYPGTASVRIEIWEKNIRVKKLKANIGLSKRPSAVARSCEHFPFYHLLLRGRKDLITDPDGKTWDFQFAFQENADPDGNSWDLELQHSSEILGCGLGGVGFDLIPGATGGPAGAIFFTDIEVTNFGEYCGTEPTEEFPTQDPEVDATCNCATIFAEVAGWAGPTVTEPTEARWRILLAADDSVLYDTGFQSDQILTFRVDLFQLNGAVDPGTEIKVEVTLKDTDGTTSATVFDIVETGEPPNPVSIDVQQMFVNKVWLLIGEYSSPSGAAHEATEIAIFAGDDTELLTPLSVCTFLASRGEALTGEFELYYNFDLTQTYRFRVVVTDEFQCASATGTEYLGVAPPGSPGEGDEENPNPETPFVALVCPIWDACPSLVPEEWEGCENPEDEWEPCENPEDTWDEAPTC